MKPFARQSSVDYETPMACPFCKDTNDLSACSIRKADEENTIGKLKSIAVTDWQCPNCGAWITHDDEREASDTGGLGGIVDAE